MLELVSRSMVYFRLPNDMSVLSFSRLQARIWGYEKPHSLTPAENLIYEAEKRMKRNSKHHRKMKRTTDNEGMFY